MRGRNASAKALFQGGVASIASKWAERETVGMSTHGDRPQLAAPWRSVCKSWVFPGEAGGER